MMVIKTQLKGRAVTGVEVGATDAQHYFVKDATAVELILDHLQIQCDLAPEFWRGHAEICDPRLNAWIEAKNFNSPVGADPIPLALIPSGKNRFRLQPVPVGKRSS